ncbi:MAG: hypothetical protein J6C23_06060 [Clostridia bacterium]|nr:hypothetical protein [Clostridia bacterium]
MEILLIVFGFIVGLVVLFTLVTVVRDMLKENREVRRTEAERRLIADQKSLIERTRLEAEQLEAEKALAKAKLPEVAAPVAVEAPAPVVIEKDDEAMKAIAEGIAEIKALLEAQKAAPAVIEAAPVAEKAVVIEEEPVAEEVVEEVVEEAPVEEVVEEPVAEEVVEEVVEEAPVEEEVAETVEEEVAEENKPDVAFNTTAKDSLDDKFFKLDDEQKGFYNEIASYAASKEDSKKFKNLRYEEYKVGKARLVRMLIKRGIVVCEFIMYNSDFKNYVNENKVSVKQAPTVIKITDAAAVQAAKDSMDIVINSINEEKEYKKQQAKERRKAARLAKAAAEAEVAETAEEQAE